MHLKVHRYWSNTSRTRARSISNHYLYISSVNLWLSFLLIKNAKKIMFYCMGAQLNFFVYPNVSNNFQSFFIFGVKQEGKEKNYCNRVTSVLWPPTLHRTKAAPIVTNNQVLSQSIFLLPLLSLFIYLFLVK